MPLTKGHAPDPDKSYLTWEEIGRLEQAARCRRDRLLIRVTRITGSRISEALALHVKDVDYRRGGLTINHLKDRITLKCLNCGGRLSRASKLCLACAQPVTEVQRQVQRHRVRLIAEQF